MVGCAADQHAADQHPDRRQQQIAGQCRIGCGHRRSIERAERDHGVIIEAAAHHREQHEENEIEQDRRRKQKPPSDRGWGARFARRVDCLYFRIFAHGQQHGRNREAENAGADKGAAPAPQALHHQEARRRHRRSEHAGKSMYREGLADTVGRDMVREQGIVGRVVDRVADAGEREHRHHDPVRIDQADDDECGGADRQPADQKDARAQPVDQEPGRCLQRGRHDVEGGEGKADLGVADVIIGAHEWQQRRQQQDVIMRDEMRRADRADDARVWRAARGHQFRCLTHRLRVPGEARTMARLGASIQCISRELAMCAGQSRSSGIHRSAA